MNKSKISDLVVDFLVQKKIDMCFSVTGGGAMHLNDSFAKNKKMKVVYNHHEQACSIAAEGYSRINNKPAIVCVTSGPGTTNAITGVLGAWLDSIPMIIISGQMKRETILSSTELKLRQLGFQEYDIIPAVKNITKYSIQLNNPELLFYHLEKAFNESISNRKGPVWIDIPLDIQALNIKKSEIRPVNFNFDKITLGNNFLKVLEDKLCQASKPVILVGYGVQVENSRNLLEGLVNKLKIPVLTEWNSHDVLPDQNLYNFGRPGTIGDRNGNIILQNSDLIILIGCQLSIRQISYEWNNFAPNAFKIGVNNEIEEMLKPTVRYDYQIVCSINDFLRKTVKELNLSYEKQKFYGWVKWCREIKNKYTLVNDNIKSESINLSVYNFFRALNKFSEKNNITVLANGAACVAGLQVSKINRGRRVFTNAGASSMGYGICASIGAAFADKNKIIYCVEGDGSIQMNIQELQTIKHHNLNIKIFWINNDGYHSIKQTQKNIFKAKEKEFYGADKFSGISFPSAKKIAAAYDYKFFKIKSSHNFESIFNKINRLSGPVICEVITNPDEDFAPKLISKINKDNTFFTPPLDDMYPFLSAEEKNLNLTRLNQYLKK
jgi:acetolactate synthase I/II/III large subunit